MFCKNCGSQVPDGMAFCAACGTPVPAAAPAEAPAAAPAEAPAANPIESVKKMAGDKNGLIKLIAILAAVAIVIGLAVGLLAGGGAKGAAKKYLEASDKGDLKKIYSLSVGKYQKYIEEEVYKKDEAQEQLFESTEKAADELNIDVKVNNFSQYYKAKKKIAKANNEENYGKSYSLSIKVVDVKDMRNSELEAIQERYDNEAMEDYINPDKIKKGKKVYVRVFADGDKDTDSQIVTVYVVKYGSQWKVVTIGSDDRNSSDD